MLAVIIGAGAGGVLPVMGADGHYCGCVTARALAEALDTIEVTDDTIGSIDRTVGDLAQMPPKITGTSSLTEALDALVGAESTGAPVLTADRIAWWAGSRTASSSPQFNLPPRPAAWQSLSGLLSR